MNPSGSSQSKPWVIGGLIGILGLILVIVVFYFGIDLPTQIGLGLAYLGLIAVVWTRAFSSNPRFFLGLIAGPILMIGVGFVAGYVIIQTDALSSVQPSELEKMVGLKLPSGMTGLHSSADGFLDTSLHARFEMPKREYPEFLRINQIELLKDQGLPFGDDALGRYWWKPESLINPKNLVKRGPQTGTLETRYTLDILAGDADGENMTVYLQVFGN
jgi:hypothetical protein